MNPAEPTAPDAQFDWPGASGPLHCRWYQGSDTKRSDLLLVFFAPGGFLEVELDVSSDCLRVVADSCGVNVLAPSYAVAPDRPFPAAVEDAHAVLGQAVKRKRELGWSGKHLFVGGVEAGGNLAAVSALMCRDRCGPKLAGQILVMPMLDASVHCACQAETQAQDKQARAEAEQITRALSRSYRCYLKRPADRSHPYASPLQASRLNQLPPAILMHAEGDPLAQEGLQYAEKLESAGVTVQRVQLPPRPMRSAEERCKASAEDPGIQALARFFAPFKVAQSSSSETARRRANRCCNDASTNVCSDVNTSATANADKNSSSIAHSSD